MIKRNYTFFLVGVLLQLTTVLLADFRESSINLPSAAEAVETRFDVDGDGLNDLVFVFHRRILIFLQQNNGIFPPTPSLDVGGTQPLPADIALISVGKVTTAPGCQLVFARPSGVDALPVRKEALTTTEKNIDASLIPILRKPIDVTPEVNLRFADFAYDLDGDGKSELILPSSHYLEVYQPDGSFRYRLKSRVSLPFATAQYAYFRREPDLLGMPLVQERLNSDIVRLPLRHGHWYGIDYAVESTSRPFLACDFNSDKLVDFITRDAVFFQTEKGEFRSQAAKVYDRIATAFGVYKNQVVLAPNLLDLNGDGRLDTFNVNVSATKLTPRTDVQVFLGKEDGSFGDKPDFTLHTRDIAYSELLPLGDVNGDGALDLALFHLDFQPQSMESQLRAYLKNGLDGELRLYLWDKQRNRFLDVFSFKHRVLVNYEIYGARQLFQQQVFINHDMDGDGLVDLVLKTGPREISCFKNLGGTKGFASKPFAVIHTPRAFSSFLVRDMNGDKKGDILASGYEDALEDRTIYSFYMNR
jgi:hypothetical protein